MMSQRLEHISCFDTQHVHAWEIDREIEKFGDKKRLKSWRTQNQKD